MSNSRHDTAGLEVVAQDRKARARLKICQAVTSPRPDAVSPYALSTDPLTPSQAFNHLHSSAKYVLSSSMYDTPFVCFR
ncbi:hypothetical protein E2C01_088721 [Portunus trituberculatus]|uniref:Uncharacterized protein n=1 Tax=Portunus trituberculatus TaxID=210409 RepID=A0A5B7JK64_PORTR|nr:hypothetical protein [Portunus trituberculatus]